MTSCQKNNKICRKRKRSAPENEVKVKVDINYHFKIILESCIFLHSQQKKILTFIVSPYSLRGSTKLVYSYVSPKILDTCIFQLLRSNQYRVIAVVKRNINSEPRGHIKYHYITSLCERF